MRRAYTLIEVLVLVVILGIAGAMVIPSFGGTDSLRVQGAIRSLVADITVQQSDAIAYQSGRGILITADGENSRYTMADVAGSALDTTSSLANTRRIGGATFGFATIDNVQLPNNMIVFDEMGGPVLAPGSDVAAPAGSLDIVSARQRYRINIEAYTGRVTVQEIPVTTPTPEPSPGG